MKNYLYETIVSNKHIKTRLNCKQKNSEKDGMPYYMVTCQGRHAKFTLAGESYQMIDSHITIFKEQREDEGKGLSCFHFTAQCRLLDNNKEKVTLRVYFDRGFNLVDIRCRPNKDNGPELCLTSAEMVDVELAARIGAKDFFIDMSILAQDAISAHEVKFSTAEKKARNYSREIGNPSQSNNVIIKKYIEMLNEMQVHADALVGLCPEREYRTHKYIKKLIKWAQGKKFFPKQVLTVAEEKDEVVHVQPDENHKPKKNKKTLSLNTPSYRTKLTELDKKTRIVLDSFGTQAMKKVKVYTLLLEKIELIPDSDDDLLKAYMMCNLCIASFPVLLKTAISEGNVEDVKLLVNYVPNATY